MFKAHVEIEILEKLIGNSSFFVYLKMGFEHIIPLGLDHILFIISLFLLSPKLKSIVWQATVFTLAHSITLGLALFGWINLSPKIIEPIIALSIVYVALENIFTDNLKPIRLFVVFVFGLIHGLGFAGILKDFGMQRGDMLAGLIGFNVGVELGQLSIILAAWLLLAKWFAEKHWYRKRLVIPTSIIIALVAGYWVVERIFL